MGTAGPGRAEKQAFSLALSDLKMQPMDGLQLLAELRQRLPQLPVLLMTAFGDVEKAVDAMRGGACDFLMKPFEPKVLLEHVRRYAVARQDDGMIAADPHTRKLLALADKVAETDATVLLTGESGTGKEVFARYLHEHSPRRKGPLWPSTARRSPTPASRRPFWHEKAPSPAPPRPRPASSNRPRAARCSLDEISEMPLGLQDEAAARAAGAEVERWAARRPSRWTSACWPPPTATWQGGRRRAFPGGSVLPPQRVSAGDPSRCASGGRHRAAGPALRPAPWGASAAAWRAPLPEAEAVLVTYHWPGNVREPRTPCSGR